MEVGLLVEVVNVIFLYLMEGDWIGFFGGDGEEVIILFFVFFLVEDCIGLIVLFMVLIIELFFILLGKSVFLELILIIVFNWLIREVWLFFLMILFFLSFLFFELVSVLEDELVILEIVFNDIFFLRV